MPELPYTGFAERWDRSATIRSRPRLIIEDDANAYYPPDRQPLTQHPVIASLPDETHEFVLLQSLYKYLNDIIIFETELVNRTAQAIARDTFAFSFPPALRLDALSVVIDEDYHAYVAMDYMQQVEAMTGIAPIALPEGIELSHAISASMEKLPADYRHGMELLGIAIAENTVTAEVAAFAARKDLKRSVKLLMSDHLSDEGRHSRFWIQTVRSAGDWRVFG